jgi:glycosyltransferase involved in cell wall biosynthesis
MITAVVLTKNSQKTLLKTLESIQFCDNVIIVDNYSTDKTEAIARNAGATFVQKELNNDFAALRNFAMEKVKDGWILFVDADEVVSNELKKEIQAVILSDSEGSFADASNADELRDTSFSTQNDRIIAYRLRRQDVFLKKNLKWGEVRTAYTKGIVRLMKKWSGKWKGKVHEVFEAKGQVGRLSGLLYHSPHQTIVDFLNDINEYSTIRANELSAKRASANILQIIFFPPLKFIYTYFIKLGFLDGPEGFIYSFMMSFHSFLVRAKLYLLHMSSA